MCFIELDNQPLNDVIRFAIERSVAGLKSEQSEGVVRLSGLA